MVLARLWPRPPLAAGTRIPLYAIGIVHLSGLETHHGLLMDSNPESAVGHLTPSGTIILVGQTTPHYHQAAR